WKLSLKRALDVFGAACGLIFLSPVLMLFALLIRLESRGPVFYCQERMGLDGKAFQMVKFRSMHTDAEKEGPGWTVANDPRRTRLGGLLRSRNIDELPQLINVLLGEMSLVGPRPERPFFVKRLMERFPGYRGRLQVPPGLTGLAQIERAYDEDEEDVRRKLAYDLFYIDHRHFLVDLKILVRTLGVVLSRKGSR
ncbi:MAG TPA: sugar transferase, partial [Candidatus Saccharimonadales bacterium]|nr:sugar transferase [Candidatus Saccharimonadales bacterium]